MSELLYLNYKPHTLSLNREYWHVEKSLKTPTGLHVAFYYKKKSCRNLKRPYSNITKFVFKKGTIVIYSK